MCEVATALPYLPSLTPDDLAEAFTFAGLKTLQSYKHPYGPLNELNAAYAGMGYGLCTHWGNITACEAEEDALPEKLALMISFTHAELRINSALVYNAHTGYLLASGRWPDLGYEKWLKNEQNSTFWNEVGGRVVLMTKGYTGGRKIEVLLLTGEDTQQKRFLDAVWKALDQPNVFAELQKPGFDEEFVVARGAAELAKRWVGETWDCVEGPWCERNRDLGDDN